MCVHGSSAVLDLKWCPSCAIIPNQRLGVLAAAMADGSVQLFAVPHKSTLASSETTITIDNPPVAYAIAKQTGSCKSLIPRVLNWRPNSNSRQLLAVGFDNGDIAIWDVHAIHNQPNSSDTLVRPMVVIATPTAQAVTAIHYLCNAVTQTCRCVR